MKKILNVFLGTQISQDLLNISTTVIVAGWLLPVDYLFTWWLSRSKTNATNKEVPALAGTSP